MGAQNFLRKYVISRQNSKLSSKGIKEGINEIIEEKKEAKEENDLIVKQTRLEIFILLKKKSHLPRYT